EAAQELPAKESRDQDRRGRRDRPAADERAAGDRQPAPQRVHQGDPAGPRAGDAQVRRRREIREVALVGQDPTVYSALMSALLLRGGLVGGRTQDVAIRGERIHAIGSGLTAEAAAEVLDV